MEIKGYIPIEEYHGRIGYRTLKAELMDKAWMKILRKYRYIPDVDGISTIPIKGNEYFEYIKEIDDEYSRLLSENNLTLDMVKEYELEEFYQNGLDRILGKDRKCNDARSSNVDFLLRQYYFLKGGR